jgi:hypothetical protein
MTTKKRRLLLIAAVPLTIAVILGVLAMLPPGSGVSKANIDRIEKGMTLAQVEEIFGEKRKLMGNLGGSLPFAPDARDDPLFQRDAAAGSSAIIEVVDDCVTRKLWLLSDETILDKIRRWLHLR